MGSSLSQGTGASESRCFVYISDSKPFLDLHAGLRNQVERLPILAHELPALPVEERIEPVEQVASFVSEILLPHAAIEERVLYPRAARLLGKSDDSRTVAEDEAAMRAWITRLLDADLADAGRLQELLYALYLLLSTHVRREEQLYADLLSSRQEGEAQDLLATVAGSPA